MEELKECRQQNQRLRDGYEQNIKLIQQRDKANNAFLQREKYFKKTIKDMQAALKQQQNQLNQYKIKMLRCKSLIDYTSIIENEYHESNGMFPISIFSFILFFFLCVWYVCFALFI